MKVTEPVVVYLPDTRGVEISRFGRGNLKLGPNVFTYSRCPRETCPGATEWCSQHCYAGRVSYPVLRVWEQNTGTMPPAELPPGCALLRLHVGGDFDSVPYIRAWRDLLLDHPWVQAFAYTKAWRVPELIHALEELRALPNLQLFASYDASMPVLPPKGWRVAAVAGQVPSTSDPFHPTYLVCPEQTGARRNCEECGFCFAPPDPKQFGRFVNLIWLEH